jgi:hypothetical protein
MTEIRLIEAINESKRNNQSKIRFYAHADNLKDLEKFLISKGYYDFDKNVAYIDNAGKPVYGTTVHIA